MRVTLLVALAACSFDGGTAPTDVATPRDGADTPDAASADAREVDAAPTPDAAPACPASYTTMSGTSRYRAAATPAQWLAAEQDCENDGAATHLVVADLAEERALVDTISSATAWIGASNRRDVNVWRWVTGALTTVFTGDSSTECGQYTTMHDHYRSVDCTELALYVCECDGAAPDPNAY